MKIPAYLIGALTGPTASLTKDVASAIWETALDENVPRQGACGLRCACCTSGSGGDT